jgi:signal transduction histidine kinase
VDVSQPPEPCWAQGDPGAVARIVRILIDNALRVAPPQSSIEVHAGTYGGWALLTVRDHGPGVAPAERELIFERFQRGSATGGRSGFGLGLAIGRELAARMGGVLVLAETGSDSAGAAGAYLAASVDREESESPGKEEEGGDGARFQLRLPVAHEDVMPVRPQAPTHRGSP